MRIDAHGNHADLGFIWLYVRTFCEVSRETGTHARTYISTPFYTYVQTKIPSVNGEYL